MVVFGLFSPLPTGTKLAPNNLNLVITTIIVLALKHGGKLLTILLLIPLLGQNIKNITLFERARTMKTNSNKQPFFFFCAVSRTNHYSVMKLSKLGSFTPTDCRDFPTFEQADKAARWMHKENPQFGYVNMR